MSPPTLTRLIAALLLFIAVFHLPYGYYTFMKIAVTCIALYNAYESRNDVQKLWLIFFIAAAIVFNPLIPIYLGHRSIWMSIDILFALLFLISVKGSNEIK